MIPFQKIFTLLIRTFSKPMVEHFKKKHKLHQGSIFGRIFIMFGRRIYIVENWINHRILKTVKTRKQTNYKDQALLQKGIQSFSQVILYGILLGLPFWELYKGQLASQEKEQKLQKRLLTLDQKLTIVNKKISTVSELLKNMKEQSQLPIVAGKVIQKEKQNEITEDCTHEKIQIKEQDENEVDLVENAIDVLAEQFEDVFDDFELSNNNTVESDVSSSPESEAETNIFSQTVDSTDVQVEVPQIIDDSSFGELDSK